MLQVQLYRYSVNAQPVQNSEQTSRIYFSNKRFLRKLQKECKPETTKNFFLLGNEIQETQESVAKIANVVNDNLQKLDVDLSAIKGVISHLVDCNAHLVQTLNFYQ